MGSMYYVILGLLGLIGGINYGVIYDYHNGIPERGVLSNWITIVLVILGSLLVIYRG